VVPALVAVQEDVGKQMRALRRMMGLKHRRARGAALGAGGVALALGALFAATLGWVLATGALPFGMLSGLDDPTLAAAGLFLAGSVVVVGGAWLVAALAHWAHLRRGRA